MSDRDVHEHHASESTSAVVRTARISWLTDPPHGHATVTGGSRAIVAVPMSADRPASEDRVTNPGELMAAAHGSAVAVLLAQILVREGSPAHELVVTATFTFAGEWFESIDRELDVEGRVPGADPSGFERAALEAVDRCAESLGAPAHAKLRLTTRLL